MREHDFSAGGGRCKHCRACAPTTIPCDRQPAPAWTDEDVIVRFSRAQFDDLINFLRDCESSYRGDGEDGAADMIGGYIGALAAHADAQKEGSR